MEPLIVLKDEDIFSDIPRYKIDSTWHERITIKVILLDDNDNISLVGIRYLLLPGGGVEDGETLEEAVVRECMEEAGCQVEVLWKVGITKEIRLKKRGTQHTHCFVAKIIGDKGEPTTTQEDEQNMKVEWFSVYDALNLLKEQKETMSPLSYNSQFNVRTHIIFLEKYIEELA